MIDHGIGSLPRRRARITPAAIALIQNDVSLTYAELAQRVDAVAAVLAGLGVLAGDRVAYLGPNDLATFEVLFATARIGAIFVPLNTRLAAEEIRYQLDDCVPAVLVLDPRVESLGVNALASAAVCPMLLRLDDAYEATAACQASHPSDAGYMADVTMQDPALIMYTSGTSGRAKGAVLTHGNITWNILTQLAHISMGTDDAVLCAAPLFHVLGLCQLTLPALYTGGKVVVMDSFHAAEFLAAISRHRATAFPLASTMLAMLRDHPDWDAADLSGVRFVVFGGSPVAGPVVQAWLDRQVEVLQGYGMTEASPGVLMAAPGGVREHTTSAGVPHYFTDVALLTADGKIVHGPGQGELLVKGPNIFSGYWRKPEATAATFVDGWYRSGDVVRVDEDGWAYVLDRLNAVIISGGENVYPAEVERVIGELDAVAECAVVPVQDRRWGEVAAAFVVLRPGQELDELTILRHLQSKLARYKIPKYVVFRTTLPRNATGKIQRLVLRDEARKLSA
ncbi:long-chain fatty acid--CoA ligase [Micromonospora fulviviridis]